MSALTHDAALLLPWYVNGTLAESERSAVADHLQHCAVCRGELESIQETRQQMQMVLASSPVPARLHRDVMSGARARKPALSRTLLQSLTDAVQALRPPSWAGALAMTIIVVQAGALGYFVLNSKPEQEVRARAVETTSSARISIVFNPLAAEGEIRAALTALGGRIVDGPSEEGSYVVELPSVAPTVLSQRLRELRARPGLVERIENVAP